MFYTLHMSSISFECRFLQNSSLTWLNSSQNPDFPFRLFDCSQLFAFSVRLILVRDLNKLDSWFIPLKKSHAVKSGDLGGHSSLFNDAWVHHAVTTTVSETVDLETSK